MWLLVLLLLVTNAALSGCRGADSAVPAERVIDLLGERPRTTVESRFLPFGSGPRHHLVDGWYENEWNPDLGLHFVWAHGRRSTVGFDVLQVLDQQFLVELNPYATDPRQRIEVHVNGEKVTSIDPAPGFREYRFLVPARLLHQGSNRLAFVHATTGPGPRRLAAAYSWILFGPECLRLRPTGRPPEPPSVRQRDGGLDVRGPAELAWRLKTPPDARLYLGVEVADDPVRVTVDAEGGAETRRLAETTFPRARLRSRALRELVLDLSPWSEAAVTLRLGVEPEPCGSAFATARLVEAAVHARTGAADTGPIDNTAGLSR